MICEEDVKRDLRRLRKVSRGIGALMSALSRYNERIEYLRSSGEEEEAKRISRIVDELRIGDTIKEATDLEAVYMTAISRLDDTDRTIILEGYVGGKPYWMVGRDIGYSEDGVKKRVKNIIKRLTELMNAM